VFVGLGLYDEMDISLRGLDEVKTADYVFAELYTSLMGGLDVGRLASLTGKNVVLVSRRMLEEDNGREVTSAARKGKTVLLVPGDPLIATTHVELRVRAERAGIRTRVIHGASIMSAAIALSGLQNYKFGRSVTVPFSDDGVASETPCNVIRRNLESGLHTFCFLDIRAEEKRCMTIKEALETLLKTEEEKRDSAVTRDRVAVGVARAGSRRPVVKADSLGSMLSYEFGDPPHTLIFPGRLHFMEAEALIVLAGAPESVRRLVD
jgi:diphthine synthase